ncbi:MAG: tRNA (adenosine(37)-N6)-threonylcarbamoyltransferase complex ATPase subunit type 1 TsaE [Elusimicrobiota bacterium]|jgi:tRNA threonylcarbamoyladenosine biosynthesis protein TsaE|nr:tRNA (adenosine(37)-N6)-threonylcarbamoyltransferase complex ATPase subunit type 1 TsaE [Elusimicrobiota bacterium]
MYKNTNIISRLYTDTIVIAQDFSKKIKVGDNIFLIGNLGSGKTVFTKSLLKSLGIKKKIINSPSFKLINEYDIVSGKNQIKCYHFDLYRLENIEEILYLGWDDYINSENICIVEWADKAKKIWNLKNSRNNFYEIKIDYIFEKKKNGINHINNFHKRNIQIKKLK